MKKEQNIRTVYNRSNVEVVEAIKRVRKFYKDPLNKYPLPLQLKKWENVLVLSPHPDDEAIGCGGLLIQYPTQCKVVYLTDGRFGDSNCKADEYAITREHEAQNAMKFVGNNNYSFLKICDGELYDAYEKVRSIDFKCVDYIFIPNVFDQHPDHKAVGNHVKRLIMNGMISETSTIAQYEVWNTLFLPTHYLDISNIFLKKKEMISKYTEQIRNIDYQERMISLNNYRGMGIDIDFAECYLCLDALSFKKIMS